MENKIGRVKDKKALKRAGALILAVLTAFITLKPYNLHVVKAAGRSTTAEGITLTQTSDAGMYTTEGNNLTSAVFNITGAGDYTISGTYLMSNHNDKTWSDTETVARGIIDVSHATGTVNITLDNVSIETVESGVMPIIISRGEDTNGGKENVNIILKGNNSLTSFQAISTKAYYGSGAIVKQGGSGTLTFKGDGNLTAKSEGTVIGSYVEETLGQETNYLSYDCNNIIFEQTGTMNLTTRSKRDPVIGTCAGALSNGASGINSKTSNLEFKSGTYYLNNTNAVTSDNYVMVGSGCYRNTFNAGYDDIKVSGGIFHFDKTNKQYAYKMFGGGDDGYGSKHILISGGTFYDDQKNVKANSLTNPSQPAYKAYIASSEAVKSLSATMDQADYPYTGKDLESQDGKIWMYLPTGDACVTLNGAKYCAAVDTSNNTELIPTSKVTKVTDITGMQTSMEAGSTISLAGVTNSDATIKTVNYRVLDAGTTDASVKGNKLTAPNAGTISMQAYVANGLGDNEYTKNFSVNVTYHSVTDVSGTVPSVITTGSSNKLPTEVTPSNASYNTLVWSLVSGDATINSNVLKASKSGDIVVRATVKNGTAYGIDFVKDYNIKIAPASTDKLDVNNGGITITQSASDPNKNTVKWGGFEGGSRDYDKKTEITVTGTLPSSNEDGEQILIDGTTADVEINGLNEKGNYKTYGDGSKDILGVHKSIIELKNGANVNLTVTGDNYLYSYMGSTAIHVAKGNNITIDGTGYLDVRALSNGSLNTMYNSAIGGAQNEPSGQITINGATINAEIGSGSEGAVIGGGGNSGDGDGCDASGYVTINGGTITTKSIQSGSALIGNGANLVSRLCRKGGSVVINGGTIRINRKWQKASSTDADPDSIFPAPVNKDKKPVYHTTVDLNKIYGTNREIFTTDSIMNGTYGIKSVKTNNDKNQGRLDMYLPTGYTTAVFAGRTFAGAVNTTGSNALTRTVPLTGTVKSVSGGKVSFDMTSDAGTNIEYVNSDTKLDGEGITKSAAVNSVKTTENGKAVIDVSDLSANTTYHYYMVALDNAYNAMSPVTELDVTTPKMKLKLNGTLSSKGSFGCPLSALKITTEKNVNVTDESGNEVAGTWKITDTQKVGEEEVNSSELYPAIGTTIGATAVFTPAKNAADYEELTSETVPVITYSDEECKATFGTGFKGNNGWYKYQVSIAAPSGYNISTGNEIGSKWESEIKLTSSMNKDVKYYLRNTSTGAITTEKTIAVKLDADDPKTVSTTYSQKSGNPIVDIWNTIMGNSQIYVTIKMHDDTNKIDTDAVELWRDTDISDKMKKTNISVDGNDASITYELPENYSGAYIYTLYDMAGNNNVRCSLYADGKSILSESTAPSLQMSVDAKAYKPGGEDAYIDEAAINIKAEDKGTSSGLSQISYQVDDKASTDINLISDTKDISTRQTSYSKDNIVTIKGAGKHVIKATAKDAAGNTQSKEMTIYLCQKNDAKLTAKDNLVYTGMPLAAGKDILFDNNKSDGTVSYSYSLKSDTSKTYTEGLPTEAGEYLIKATIGPDINKGYMAAEDNIDVIIGKNQAQELKPDEKHYVENSTDTDSINIEPKLAKDRGVTKYEISDLTDKNGILDNVSVNEKGVLTYQVKNSAKADDTAKITVNAIMSNYNDLTYTVNIGIDKKPADPGKTDDKTNKPGNSDNKSTDPDKIDNKGTDTASKNVTVGPTDNASGTTVIPSATTANTSVATADTQTTTTKVAETTSKKSGAAAGTSRAKDTTGETVVAGATDIKDNNKTETKENKAGSSARTKVRSTTGKVAKTKEKTGNDMQKTLYALCVTLSAGIVASAILGVRKYKKRKTNGENK